MNNFYTSDYLKAVINSGRATVGRHSYGDVSVAGDISKLHIGKFCSIAYGLTVFVGDEHNMNRVTTYPFCAISRMKKLKTDWGAGDLKGHPCTKGDVYIGNDVWIGANVTILSGVSVGDGAVIGTNALVTKNVSEYSVVGGNPARFIKWRFPENIREALLRIKWWEWDDADVKKAVPLLCGEDIAEFIARYDSSM